MANLQQHVVYEEDEVCYNCDLFERDDSTCRGECLFRGKHFDNEQPACKRFSKRKSDRE